MTPPNGFLMGRRVRENKGELHEFLANPAVEDVSIDGRVARVFDEHFRYIRRIGAIVLS